MTPIHPGIARGEVLKLSSPLSFWGGVDRETGRIVDVHHPEHGESVAGKVLVMPTGRGSSSGSSVLAEVLRSGCGPVAILLREVDLILSLGVMVAADLYAVECPVAVLSQTYYDELAMEDVVAVDLDRADSPLVASRGTITFRDREAERLLARDGHAGLGR